MPIIAKVAFPIITSMLQIIRASATAPQDISQIMKVMEFATHVRLLAFNAFQPCSVLLAKANFYLTQHAFQYVLAVISVILPICNVLLAIQICAKIALNLPATALLALSL